METNLVIGGLLTPFASRGVSQTLDPIPQAVALRRSVNGDLIDLSVPELRKYRSTVTCTDQDVPALDGAWPGLLVTVDCVVELAYPGDTGGPPAGRVAVPGSERVQGDFVFYRPRLAMRVLSYSVQTDEYGAVTSWTLELEEA